MRRPRRLGWPVGTVKSRLARGRKRLRGRLLRRGLVPDDASEPVDEVRTGIFPAGLTHTTVEAMLRFASGPLIEDTLSAASLSWALHTLRTLQMTRLAVISAVLILGVVASGTAILAGPRRETLQTSPAAFEKTTTQKRDPNKPAVPDDQIETLTVRVVDHSDREVADVLVKVVEVDNTPADDGPGYRTGAYRTGADGRARIAVDRRFSRITFESRPDDRTRGWASLYSGRLSPKATDQDPVTLTLVACKHQVEGTIVDTRGKPIGGVHVRAVVFNHDKNGLATNYSDADGFSLASTVTDETGRYRLTSLPQETSATFRAYHPRFVGPTFSSKANDKTVPSVTLEDAGGIAGTLVDAATGQPLAGAQIDCQRIEHTERILNGNWGSAVSDGQGQFKAGGLAPGVYNVLLQSSPRGRRFTARAVEGVRVKAGEDARADLRLIAGRRVHGTARTGRTDKPMVASPIFCYSESHPRSGAACQGTYTDLQGRFEHFVPPGFALVYIAEPGQFGLEYRQILNVPDDRDVDSVSLKQGDDPNTKQPPGGAPIVECEVRVRVKMEAGDKSAPKKEDRNLSGRVFSKGSAPLVGVQLYHNGQTMNEAATDRQGIFRLTGLPYGPLRLGLRRNHDQQGWMRIPDEAVEVDVIIPESSFPFLRSLGSKPRPSAFFSYIRLSKMIWAWFRLRAQRVTLDYRCLSLRERFCFRGSESPQRPLRRRRHPPPTVTSF